MMKRYSVRAGNMSDTSIAQHFHSKQKLELVHFSSSLSLCPLHNILLNSFTHRFEVLHDFTSLINIKITPCPTTPSTLLLLLCHRAPTALLLWTQTPTALLLWTQQTPTALLLCHRTPTALLLCHRAPTALLLCHRTPTALLLCHSSSAVSAVVCYCLRPTRA